MKFVNYLGPVVVLMVSRVLLAESSTSGPVGTFDGTPFSALTELGVTVGVLAWLLWTQYQERSQSREDRTVLQAEMKEREARMARSIEDMQAKLLQLDRDAITTMASYSSATTQLVDKIEALVDKIDQLMTDETTAVKAMGSRLCTVFDPRIDHETREEILNTLGLQRTEVVK